MSREDLDNLRFTCVDMLNVIDDITKNGFDFERDGKRLREQLEFHAALNLAALGILTKKRYLDQQNILSLAERQIKEVRRLSKVKPKPKKKRKRFYDGLFPTP